MLQGGSKGSGPRLKTQPSRHGWKTVPTGHDPTFFHDQSVAGTLDICGYLLSFFSVVFIFFTLPISAFFCVKIVNEYERAVIFRLGRLLKGGTRGPGLVLLNPLTDSCRIIDLRVLSFDIPLQEILSKDSVTIKVEVVVYFRISNATISVTNVEDSSRSTKLLAQTTLRNILGTKTLSQTLSDRDSISLEIQETLDMATYPWGVKVERIEIKDLRMPVELQKAMASEAEASRDARAKVIAASGEQKAARSLSEAAKIIAQSPTAIQLRYLQTLINVSSEKNKTIVIPIPIELVRAIQQHAMTGDVGICGWILTFLAYGLTLITLPISAFFCIKVVQEYERQVDGCNCRIKRQYRAVIFRLGRLVPGGARGPGIVWINPFIDSCRKLDLRVLSFAVPPQEASAIRDVTVAVDAVVYFRILNATISVTNIEDSSQSTKLLAQTTLRTTLAQILSDRDAISSQMQSVLDEATFSWGVKVERVEMKDVRLPMNLQRSMASEAEASRDARAKVIAASGEKDASQALSNAAAVIAESPTAVQLRYLQTLSSISSSKNHTVIAPFPIELIKNLIYRANPKAKKPLNSPSTLPEKRQ
ncbi:hypothetical protein M3Y96_00205900 [Aphelenchoides besseyi]|nr:hypothetical protein M3Y96_00205900 [Aphelenchoides besseyi]